MQAFRSAIVLSILATAVTAASAAPPEVYCCDGKVLEQAKNLVKTTPKSPPQYLLEVRKRGESALKMSPVSVMEKEYTPPRGISMTI
jgi:hypothetical protein